VSSFKYFAMKISIFTAVLSASAAAVPLDSRSAYKSDDLLVASNQNLKTYYSKNPYPNAKCTLKNAAVRKEWYVRTSTSFQFHSNVSGPHCHRKKRQTISARSNVLRTSPLKLQLASLLEPRIATTTLSRPTSTKPCPFMALATS
jgi:hypothetical protein